MLSTCFFNRKQHHHHLRVRLPMFLLPGTTTFIIKPSWRLMCPHYFRFHHLSVFCNFNILSYHFFLSFLVLIIIIMCHVFSLSLIVSILNDLKSRTRSKLSSWLCHAGKLSMYLFTCLPLPFFHQECQLSLTFPNFLSK